MGHSVTVGELPSPEETLALYESVGWSAYTREPERLQRALEGASAVFTVRGQDGALLGLARTITDGESITYLQDLLVSPRAQRKGIGTLLLDAVQEASTGIRQLVLMTDSEPGQRAFYEANGLTEVHDLQRPARAFVRLL